MKNSQFINSKEWKEITIKFIKEVILDIIKYRINKNSYEEDISLNKNSKNERYKENIRNDIFTFSNKNKEINFNEKESKIIIKN